jgi:hypothetical protein
MNKLEKLMEKWKNATQKAEDTRNDIESFLYPLINILHGTAPRYRLTQIDYTKGGFRICTVSERDPDAWKDWIVPLEIIEAKDPGAAAVAYSKKMLLSKDTEEQNRIKAEIARLQGLIK